MSRNEALDIVRGIGRVEIAPSQRAQRSEEKNDWYVEQIQHLTPAALLPGASDLLESLRRLGIVVKSLGDVPCDGLVHPPALTLELVVGPKSSPDHASFDLDSLGNQGQAAIPTTDLLRGYRHGRGRECGGGCRRGGVLAKSARDIEPSIGAVVKEPS